MESTRTKSQKIKHLLFRFMPFTFATLLALTLGATVFIMSEVVNETTNVENVTVTDSFDASAIEQLRNLEKKSITLEKLNSSERSNPFNE